VTAVVSRIDEFADVDVELGAEVLADGALVHDIGKAVTAEQAVERVKDALDVKAEQLRERALLSSQREVEARQKQDAAEKRAATAEADASEAIRKHDRVAEELRLHKQSQIELSSSVEEEREVWKSENASLSEAVAAERSNREETDRKVAALEQQTRRAVRRRRIAASVAVIATLVAVATTLVATDTVNGAWQTTGVAVGLLGGIWIVLLYLMGLKRAGRAILTALALVGGIMAIYAAASAIIDGTSSSHHSSGRALPAEVPRERR
jgi:hypothetical protein